MEKGNTFDLLGFISFILLVGVFYFNNLIECFCNVGLSRRSTFNTLILMFLLEFFNILFINISTKFLFQQSYFYLPHVFLNNYFPLIVQWRTLWNLFQNNVNGIQSTKKRLKLIEYFKSNLNSEGFLFLQETHSTLKDEVNWTQEFKGQLFFSQGKSNSCGVLICYFGSKNLKNQKQNCW